MGAFPVINIRKMITTVIGDQPVQYFVNQGRLTNAAGLDIPQFAAPVTLKGSIQPIPRQKYEYLGLDFAKNYVNFYTNGCVKDLQRNIVGDQFVYAGKRYQCETKTAWETVDSWCVVLAVEISLC